MHFSTIFHIFTASVIM